MQTLRKWLTPTTFLSCIFIAYMSWSLHSLYQVAVPPIPIIPDSEASRRGLMPLWRSQKELSIFITMGIPSTIQQGRSPPVPPLFSKSTNSSLQILALSDSTESFSYSWGFGSGLDIFVEIHILPNNTGIQIVCARDTGSSEPEKIAPACKKAASKWRQLHPDEDDVHNNDKSDEGAKTSSILGAALSRAASDAGIVTRHGLLPSLYRSIQSLLGSDEESKLDSVLLKRGKESLTVFKSESPAAAKIARLLVKGKPVDMHAAVAWKGVMPDNTNNNSPLGGDFTVPFDPTRVVSGSASLVTQAEYIPSKPMRFLWLDLLGSGKLGHTFASIFDINRDQYNECVEVLMNGKSKVVTASSNLSSIGAVKSGTLVPHWLGQFDVKLIMETITIPRSELDLPPRVRPYIRRANSPVDGTMGYLPILAANPVRPLRERYHALNSSSTLLPLHIRIAPVSIGTWQLMSTLDSSLTMQRNMGANDKDTDDVIRLVAETPMWLLGLTFFVSAVHLLFDMLAIKSDISFWSQSKSMRGISIRSLGIDLVSQFIVTLYLYAEGASLLVLIPQSLSALLVVWKLLLASGIVWRWQSLAFNGRISIVLPVYDAALAATASELGTNKFDAEALRYLSLILGPLLIGFVMYQFIFVMHASWGSFLLTTAVSMVYSCGFALMTPQLFINYKLKSVAHLPWAVLGYRFFNTVIDDLFAFIIKMPTMARVAVFRDDIVFVAYMFQRWHYPVDKSRPAEGFDDEDTTSQVKNESTDFEEKKNG